MHFPITATTTAAASILAEKIDMVPLIIELILFVLLVVFFFVIRYRTWKILSICCAEFCLWMACKTVFVKGAWIVEIMTWVTALTIICLSVAIVNRINWGSLRGDNKP